jgi:3-oxoacyl-[acyl-carrier protein] reductase
MTSTNELAGKVALVTGAGQNIGRAIALDLAAGGAAVAVNTRSSRADVEKVAREIRDTGGQAEVFMANVADAAAVNAMVGAVIERFGRVDILVLNASVRREVPFTEMTFEAWREILDISLDGSFHCIKACLPSMIANRGGNIVTLGGDGALSGIVGKVHGSAAKGGLAGMTRALARELAPNGIRVNCVSPGSIDTSRAAHRPPRQGAAGRIPLGRHGAPAEIAAMVRFLCGPGAGFITGQTIHVNGGERMFW